MIGILDYGLGNIRAFYNIYHSLNIPCTVIKKTSELININKIILPGVGSFDFAMQKFNDSGFKNIIEKMVLIDKMPVLGICVGMQMLAKSSDEGNIKGLGWIDADVKNLNNLNKDNNLILPHMGWNKINFKSNNPLFNNFKKDSSNFYFLHSYYFKCNNNTDSIAQTNYGQIFSSAVNADNIYGVQFHPEKSHNNGMDLLYNFSKL
tara:strand:- start:191 stop:808 length:618 start_codon:yes stop_codon:yes gene_type:complete